MAVFFCAALIPPEAATASAMVKTMGGLDRIDLPTVHIIGRKDPCEGQSLELVKLCTNRSAQVLPNDGGHDIPRDAVNSKKISVAIEHALRLAFSG